jgi:hypothetical protein
MDDSYVLKKTKSTGTVCSIDDVSLRRFGGRLCAAPLTDKLLGIAHRIRPSVSPNRALDVNLCFLRVAFREHKSLYSSIEACMRCDDTTLHTETLSEMMFQVILLRFTGRICRYEEYKLSQKKYNYEPSASCRFLPLRNDISSFLDYMESRQKKRTKQNGIVTMTGWISRQHDGVIPYDLKTNLYKFQRFLSNIAENVGSSVRNMRKKKKERNSCVQIIKKLIQSALAHACVNKTGNVSWIAHVAAADIEEFVVDPFGMVTTSSVHPGPYSLNGKEMINNGLLVKKSFGSCLECIVHHVNNDTCDDLLPIMGYKKTKKLPSQTVLMAVHLTVPTLNIFYVRRG